MMRFTSTRHALFALMLGCAGGSVPVPAGPESNAESLHITGGDIGQRAELAVAIRAADKVYGDPAFWAIVRERAVWLRAQSDETSNGALIPAILPGEDVAKALSNLRPSDGSYEFVRVFHWYNVWRWMFAGKTNAITDVCGPTRLLRRKIGTLAALIDTVAHENTHRVSTTGCSTSVQWHTVFTDTPPQVEAEPWLVSYAIGDLAECYSVYGPNRERTLQCFAHTVDGGPACRLHQECCVQTTSPAVGAARGMADWCRPYLKNEAACSALKQHC